MRVANEKRHSKSVILGAGAGMIVGWALGATAVGMVLGAAVGLIVGVRKPRGD